ncbi:uncharacterized protein [Apostichopus japonicus]
MREHGGCPSAMKFFMKLKQQVSQHWDAKFGKFIIKKNEPSNSLPSQVPAIRFYSYWSNNQVFAGPWTQRALKNLLSEVLHIYESRIPLLTEEKDLYESPESLTLIVFLPDITIQSLSQEDMQKLRSEFDSIAFFIHHFHGNAKEETNSLPEKFLIKESPSAILFNVKEERTISRVDGPFKFLQRIEEMLITQTSVAVDIITEDLFHSWLQSTDTSTKYLMCFHAVWADRNLDFLRTFSSAAKILSSLQEDLKFGFVDVEKEREILSKHIHPKHITKLPSCVLIWKTETPTGFEVHQEALKTRPTPWEISNFLHSLELHMTDREGNIVEYIPWEMEDNCQSFVGVTMHQPHCFGNSNQSFVSWEDEESNDNILQHLTSHHDGDRFINQTDLMSQDGDDKNGVSEVSDSAELRIGNLLRLTDDSWQRVIEQSHVHPRSTPMPYSGGASPWDESSPTTTLVAFIQSTCRSCENNMPLFEKLSTNLEKLGTGDFYVLNCSSDKASCEHQNVRGFPTLIAYRNFGRQRTERCRSESLTKQYLRMDYHGILTEKLVMEWFLQISTPTVQYATKDGIGMLRRINDISLHATLYPVSLAGKYLPTISGPNSWYPFECFQLACDRLYGKAACYGEISENLNSRDATIAQREQDMVVTQIEMHRRDNVSALVFSLGKALITTLQNEDNIQLHKFHTPHRYELKSGQRCEDNHPACTDVIVSFVTDHSRLPVTHITAAAFHTHGSLGFGKEASSSIFAAGLPVLLTLATSEQLSEKATFYLDLQDIAYKFYNQVVFASLNVDEFPQWAARFVPHGYSRHVVENDKLITEDMIPDLFIYPRLCIVTAENHQRAAFLPDYVKFSLGSLAEGRTINKSNIEQFVTDFMTSPDDKWVQTELF